MIDFDYDENRSFSANYLILSTAAFLHPVGNYSPFLPCGKIILNNLGRSQFAS